MILKIFCTNVVLFQKKYRIEKRCILRDIIRFCRNFSLLFLIKIVPKKT